MARRRRYDPDPEINSYVSAWHRAGATALLALGLFVGWAFCAYLGSDQTLQPALAAIPRLFAMVFGWGAIAAVIAAVGGYAYAYMYPPWRDR